MVFKYMGFFTLRKVFFITNVYKIAYAALASGFPKQKLKLKIIFSDGVI